MRGSSIQNQFAQPDFSIQTLRLAVDKTYTHTRTVIQWAAIGLITLMVFVRPATVWGQCNPTGNPTRYEYTVTPNSMLNITGMQFCTSQSMSNNCCGVPSNRCLDLVFNLQNGPMGEEFSENCNGLVSLLTQQGNFNALFFSVDTPNPAGGNVDCASSINLGNNYTITVLFSGNGMGQIVAELTLLNNMGVPVFNDTQNADPGQAVIFTICKPGFGCVTDEIVFGCCDAAASLTLNGPDTYCTGDSSALKVTGFNGTPPYTVTIRAASANDTSYFDIVIPDDLDGNPAMDMLTFVVKPTDTTTYCAISVEDGNGCVQPVTSDKIMVSVNPVPEITLTITGPDGATCGEMVDIVIETTTGFDNLAGLQYSVNWDETQLQYLSHTALPIGPGGNPLIGTVNALSNGELTYSWSAPGSGQTLADGTVLLTISMQVVAATGSAVVDITGMPLFLEVTNEAFCMGTVIPQNNVDIVLNNVEMICPDDFAVCTSSLPFDLTTLVVSPTGGVFSGNGVTGDQFNGDAGTTTTITYTYTDPNNGCSNSCTFDIAVVGTPTIDPVNDQTVCAGDDVAQIDFSSNVPGASVSWSRTPEAIGLPATAGDDFVPAFTAANAGNAPLTSIFTVTASFTANGLTCVATPINFEITVNPIPTINPADGQTVCNGGQTDPISFSGSVPGTVFNWINDDPSIGLDANGTGDIPAFIAINNGNTPVTATITVTPTYTNNGVTCTGTSISLAIIVSPTPSVNPVPDQTVCTGTPVAQINFSSNMPGATFTWSRTPEAIGLPGLSGGNFVPAFVAANAGNTPLTSTFTATASYTNNGTTCLGAAINFEITVNPTPGVDPVNDQTVCNGELTEAVVFSSPVNNTVFNWTNSTPSIGLAANGTGNIPAFAAINNSNAPVTATITVTPTYTNDGVPCNGAPFVFTITVNPIPSVNPVANQLVCSGDATAAVVFSGAVPGTVFNWTNSTPAIGLAASGTGNIPSFLAQNPGNTPLVATITVTPLFINNSDTCTGTPIAFTITVDPRPTVFAGFDQIICQNQTALLAATLSGGATGGTWSGGAGTFANPNATSTTYTPDPSEYGTTVTLTFTTNDPLGPCPAASDDVNVTINTSPIVNAGNDIMICQNENLALSNLGASIAANGSGVTTGFWSTSGSGTFQPNNLFPPGATTYVPSPADRAAGSVVLTLTSADPAGPCAPVTDQVILSFLPLGGLVCNDKVTIALGPSGMEVILPDMVLEAPNPSGMYLVEVFVNGVNIGNKVDCSHIGKNVVVKVTDLCSGVFCTTVVMVMDNLAPKLTCTDIVLICAVTNYSPAGLAALGIPNIYPDVEENCGQYTLSNSDTWHDLTCDDDYIGYARRVWTATDAGGLKGTCVQLVYFEQKGIDDLTLPSDVTLDCNNGPVNTTPQNTGAPYLTAYGINFPIYPNAGFCRLSAIPLDNILPSCEGTYDIIRTWTIYDWCKPTTPTPPTTNPRYHVQIIRVVDKTGPVVDCPGNLTVSTDPLACCATVDLPDVIIRDGCSSIRSVTARVEVRHPITGDVIATYDVPGALVNFPGNNLQDPDTLAVFGFTPCLPQGTHTVTYHVEDNCNNTSDCTFNLTVTDLVPPVTACDEITQVTLGLDGMAFINATTFDDGSYDVCSSVYFKARRYEANSCQDHTLLHDQVKFCCEDVGDTILIILRVYDALPPAGSISPDLVVGNYNECQVQVYVDDKIKPTCTAPAHATVSCENFDPSLWAYGMASGTDNCCLDTITTLVNLSQFDTVCNRGTITRTFRVFDCGGQSTTCTQRIVVTYNQHYFIKFPNDWNITQCNSGFDNFGEPEFFGKDCELMGVSHQDVLFTVVPDACFKIERTWTIINWCSYDPNKPCIDVPNPNPNALPDHPSNLVGPIMSPAGTPAPWAPTNVRVNPTDPLPTDYSTFWSASANCYRYKQIIKVTDKKVPDIQCPTSPVEFCDQTANDPQLWNEPHWFDNLTGKHDLCEGPADLCITATDDCSGSNVKVRYLLFLDLDNNGDMETVISSANPPAPNTVFFGNANTPNYAGGTPRAFDGRPVAINQKYQFAIETNVSGNNKVACVRWNTQLQPNNYVVPELPYGTHKIKWIVEDGCGNERVCEYTFVVKDCKAPTVVCYNGLSTNLMATKMVMVNYQTFVKEAYDNCTPSNLLIFGMRKANTGTGFPFNPNGTPQTSVNFDCTELGFRLVEIWAMDLAGNTDFCSTYIHVQDNAGVCSSNNASVAGMLQTESGSGVEDVTVQVQVTTPQGTVNLIANTDQDGYYLVPNALPATTNAVIAPIKDNDPLNGVSTFDLVLINKHILGLEPLKSPYKMIAADANNSRSITTLDIVELRKLILGITTDLPNNTSWRFVDKTFQFPNAANPFQTIFPETKSVVDPQTHLMYEDFVAVKTGDVNGNAVTNSIQFVEERTIGTLLFDVEHRDVRYGEVFTVELRPAEPTVGYQFSLYHPGLEIVDIRPGGGMSADNFGIHALDQALTVSYFADKQAGGFAVTFRARSAGPISTMLNVSSRITKAEAYRTDGQNDRGTAAELLDVALRFSGGETETVAGVGFELYQNQPNPWTNRTRLGFHLPEASAAILTIYDETGKVLFTHSATFERGYNSLTVENSMLSTASGLLFYRLETPKHSAVRRMAKFKM